MNCSRRRERPLGRQLSQLPLFLPLLLFFLSLSFSHSAHPCGGLLPSLASYCASSRGATPQLCCDTLAAWDESLCWCESPAASAAVSLSSNEFGFVWRGDYCQKGKPNSTQWRHQGFPGSRGSAPIPPTCPASFKSNMGNDCGEKTDMNQLATMRLNNVKKFIGLEGSPSTGIEGIATQLDGIFVDNPIMTVAGLGMYWGKVAIEEYVASRTKYIGDAVVPWTAGAGGVSGGDMPFNVWWRPQGMLSYQLTRAKGRIDFVQFEPCGSKIEQIIIAYTGAYFSPLFAQYLYKGDGSMFDEYTKTAQQWCTTIGQRCQGTLNPFGGSSACTQEYNKLLANKKVTCTKFEDNEAVSMSALSGENVACRSLYISLAKVNPQKYCPLIPDGAGKCLNQSCPGNQYTNIFQEKLPRYLQSNFFTCSSDGCDEDWP